MGDFVRERGEFFGGGHIGQQGKAKVYTYDGLGRLASVQEDPSGLNFATSYQYDPLGNLKGVTQASQTRSYSYDSLSRQVSATNPESGTMSYAYDAAGNLSSQRDARGVTTTNSYDTLNRPTTTVYSDGTPTVSVTYGTLGNGIDNSLGQIVTVRNSVSTTNYTMFDTMGRVLASNQQTLGQTYNFAYGYNLAGALTTETYPTGRIIATSYDGMNRAQQISGIVGASTTNYVSSASYWPHGALSNYTRGNGLFYSAAYNSRLQPSEIYAAQGNGPGNSNNLLALSCLNWGTQRAGSAVCPGFTAAPNNGTLLGKTDYAGGPAAPSSLISYPQTYSYDKVNRLTAANDANWSRTFGYDQYGNMSVTGNTGAVLGGLTPQSANNNPFNTNNQLVSSSFHYDLAGNMTLLGSVGIQYDAANRQTQTSDSLLHVQANYGYDGIGQRVTKVLASGPTSVYVYDALGELASEYTTASNTAPCSPCYLSYDHLGSVRMVTDQTGNVVSRHEYLPYGEELAGGSLGRSAQFGAAAGVRQRFTGQERDYENSPPLDYFTARYMNGTLGRFLSPDPGIAGANITNPQSWNAYAYVLGNPLGLLDPSGLDPIQVTCSECTTTVYSGPSDPLDPFNYPLFYGAFEYGQSLGQQPTFSVTTTAKAPVQTVSSPPKSGTKQTFSQCMAAYANDSSIAGGLNHTYNAITGSNSLAFQNNFFAQAVLGNPITTLAYGSATDNAGTAASLAPTIVQMGMGTVTSYGRRTTTIMALNLAGKGGVPLALGAASAGTKAAIGRVANVAGGFMSLEVSLAVNVVITAAEAAYCASQP